MQPYYRPQVVIGFADGAAGAARLLLRDSSSAALVALVPSTTRDTAALGEIWEQMLLGTDRARAVLVLESLCNSERWMTRGTFRERQTVLLLPHYDGWLSRRSAAACPPSPASAVSMDYELMSILTDWLERTVSFPE